MEYKRCLICGIKYIPKTVSKYCSVDCRRTYLNYTRDLRKWGIEYTPITALEGARKRYAKRIKNKEVKDIEIEETLEAPIEKPHQRELKWVQVSSSAGYYAYR